MHIALWFLKRLIRLCVNVVFFSSARKGDGEGGIVFDNEDEKEQWEEDQKVSGVLGGIPLLVEMSLFWFDIPNFAGTVCSKPTGIGT